MTTRHDSNGVSDVITPPAMLGVLGGVAPVEVERITQEAIRTGSWRRPVGDPTLAASPQPVAGSADPIGDIARRVAAERP